RAEQTGASADARRLYMSLVTFDDTGVTALIGLARVHARLGDAAKASQALVDLETRFADRTIDGVPVRVVVATLRAQARAPRRVARPRAGCARSFRCRSGPRCRTCRSRSSIRRPLRIRSTR